MKSEPEVYSVEDLEKDQRATWEGVRNYQARNYMRDEMKVGDLALFYHSNAKPPGVVGVAEIVREAYPDPTARDPASPYYDKKASVEHPIWLMVDVRFVKKFPRLVSLDELRSDRKLDGLLVIKRGMRLSIQPVEPNHFKRIVELAS